RVDRNQRAARGAHEHTAAHERRLETNLLAHRQRPQLLAALGVVALDGAGGRADDELARGPGRRRRQMPADLGLIARQLVLPDHLAGLGVDAAQAVALRRVVQAQDHRRARALVLPEAAHGRLADIAGRLARLRRLWRAPTEAHRRIVRLLLVHVVAAALR